MDVQNNILNNYFLHIFMKLLDVDIESCGGTELALQSDIPYSLCAKKVFFYC